MITHQRLCQLFCRVASTEKVGCKGSIGHISRAPNAPAAVVTWQSLCVFPMLVDSELRPGKCIQMYKINLKNNSYNTLKKNGTCYVLDGALQQLGLSFLEDFPAPLTLQLENLSSLFDY